MFARIIHRGEITEYTKMAGVFAETVTIILRNG